MERTSEKYEQLIIEEDNLLTSIQVTRNDLQTDLLYTRLNKSVIANQMKESKDTNTSSGMWNDC